MPQGMKPESIRTVNRKAALKLFVLRKEMTATQLAKELGLSRTAVVRILHEFLQQGLVEEAGKGSSTIEGGKRPERFRFNEDLLYSISVRINRTDAVIEQRTLTAKKLHSVTVELAQEEDYAGSIERIAQGIRGLMRYYGLEVHRLIGIVVGSDGVQDVQRGILRVPAHHAWGRDLPVCSDLAARLDLPGVPLWLGNMVMFAGYEQLRRDPGQRLAVLLLAGISGSAVVEENSLPFSDACSEAIHMIVKPDAQEICAVCGQKGCFHAMISARRLIRLYREKGERKDIQSLEAIFAAAEEDDETARALLRECAECFAVLLHNLSVTVRPQRILIGDRWRSPGAYAEGLLQEVMRSLSSARFSQSMRLTFGGGFEDFAPGAAWYAALQYLNTDQNAAERKQEGKR